MIKITMRALVDKRTEVLQTLLSLIEATEKTEGCLSSHLFREIDDKTIFSLIEEWKNRENMEDHFRSDRFSVLLGTRSLLCEPQQIEIHTISRSEGMETVNAARGKGR